MTKPLEPFSDETINLMTEALKAIYVAQKSIKAEGVLSASATEHCHDYCLCLMDVADEVTRMAVTGTIVRGKMILAGNPVEGELTTLTKKDATDMLSQIRKSGLDPDSVNVDKFVTRKNGITDESDSEQASRLLSDVFGKDYPGVSKN